MMMLTNILLTSTLRILQCDELVEIEPSEVTLWTSHHSICFLPPSSLSINSLPHLPCPVSYINSRTISYLASFGMVTFSLSHDRTWFVIRADCCM